jgi:hypothetical protein
VDDESNINTPDKNFTFKASDPYASTIKIEWVTKSAAYDLPTTDADWKTGTSLQHGSHTCTSSTCSLCIQGGTCDYPGLPAEAISVQPNGEMNNIYFRVTVSDNYGNSVMTGFDNNTSVAPALDKYVLYRICGPKCESCNNTVPEVSGVDSCSGNLHKFDWSLEGRSQSAYNLQVQEVSSSDPNINPIHESDGTTAKTLTTSPGALSNGDLDPSKTYRWRVRAKDIFSPDKCEMWSLWSDWQTLKNCGPVTPPPGNCVPVNNKPYAVTVAAQNSETDPCRGFTYTLTWHFGDDDTDDGGPDRNDQSAFEINIREYKMAGGRQDTSVPIYYTGKIAKAALNNSNPSYTLYGDVLSNMTNMTTGAKGLTLEYGKIYEWQVRVTDNDPRNECSQVSDWSPWSGNRPEENKSIKMDPNHPPIVSFTVTNDDDNNCLQEGNCQVLQVLHFKDNGSQVFTSDQRKTYQWYVDDAAVSAADGGKNASFDKLYSFDVSKKQVHVVLQVTDSSNLTCNNSGYIAYSSPKPVWNEVIPK